MATKFSSDTATTPSEKNGKLAELLETSWNNLKVEKVERIETELAAHLLHAIRGRGPDFGHHLLDGAVAA